MYTPGLKDISVSVTNLEGSSRGYCNIHVVRKHDHRGRPCSDFPDGLYFYRENTDTYTNRFFVN